ncbi:hypothetical protein D7Y25_00190 [Parabacteroides goldsteinii]|uniref:Uncharacterized protein n=2 Tax=Parabacteroides goldsteinii TaxID=328812 RepID=S0GTG5_9BACT|nr:hypothetical protein C803_02079 [Parabacteroides goldsteinii dnLKV18]KAI4360284.1 hypothetical protein C825_002336 [Parabacteroides sp. ASF519]RLT86965.1 hypothetical protein D7Y25_00190 [Parabacteroides goldsteinii]
MFLMNYRIISKDSLLKLTHKEAFVFCCIVLNTDLENDGKIYISHIKEETLAKMAECTSRTIVTYIKKFKQLGLLDIKTEKIKGELGVFDRNTYSIKIPDSNLGENWFRLNYDFLKEEISSDMKGFLLLLKCLGINGSNTVLYSLDKIGKQKLLHVGLNKIKELTRLGISLQVISKAKTGYVITDKFIYEDLPEQKADSPTEQLLVDYYNRIVSYCKRQEMKPPKYDKELMKIIFNNCPNFEFFVDKMNNRNYPKEKISNLMYFIKTLNFDIPESNEKAKDDCIIMT